MSNAERRSLKARRNIISFRLRQRRQETEQELVTKIIPELQTFVSEIHVAVICAPVGFPNYQPAVSDSQAGGALEVRIQEY